MPTPYQRGRGAEYRVVAALRKLNFSCIRAASSHGVFDVAGVRADTSIFVQIKQGSRPSPSDYQTLIDMPVPVGAVKCCLWYSPGASIARVVFCNLEALPEWFGIIKWLTEAPKQKKLRGLL